MSVRTIRTSEEWRRLLADYRASGEPANVFCARHNIHTTSLYGRLRKESASKKPKARLLPVVELETRSMDSVEVTLPKGSTLRFSPGASANYITSILKGIG